jgi:hypothetical protein
MLGGAACGERVTCDFGLWRGVAWRGVASVVVSRRKMSTSSPDQKQVGTFVDGLAFPIFLSCTREILVPTDGDATSTLHWLFGWGSNFMKK